MRDIIEIDKELIPYSFEIELGADMYTLEINYNEHADLFTATLYKDEEILSIEPIIYGVPLFQDVYEAGVFPPLDIVPLDEAGNETAVTWDNFNKTVFLTIDDEGAAE